MSASRPDECKAHLAKISKLEGQSDQLVNELKAVADKARDPSWRPLLREFSLLEAALKMLAKHKSDLEVRQQCLRISGNCCIDNDENRKVVLDLVDGVLWEFHPDRLVQLGVAVVNNLICDYPPAREGLAKLGFIAQLLSYIEQEIGPDRAEDAMDKLDSVLELFLTLSPESDKHGVGPIVLRLFELATTQHVDAHLFGSLVEIALDYLDSMGKSSDQFSDRELFCKFCDVYERIPIHLTDEDSEIKKKISLAHSKMLHVLTDFAEDPKMRISAPFSDTSILDRLVQWLDSDSVQMQAAACLGLGNMIMSPEASEFVLGKGLHRKVINCLANPKGDTELHCAGLALLKHIAIPTSCRRELGEAGLLTKNILRRLWENPVFQQTQMGAVTLARMLVTKTSFNVECLLGLIHSQKTDSSRQEDGALAGEKTVMVAEASERTDFDSLLELHLKTDVPQIKLETGRIANVVCLTELPWQPDTNENTAAAKLHNRYPQISDTLSHLITQDMYPVLRSEAWLVLAIMVQTAGGCAIASEIIKSEGVLDRLRAAATTPAATIESGDKEGKTEPVEEGVTDVKEDGKGLDFEPNNSPANPKEEIDSFSASVKDLKPAMQPKHGDNTPSTKIVTPESSDLDKIPIKDYILDEKATSPSKSGDGGSGNVGGATDHMEKMDLDSDEADSQEKQRQEQTEQLQAAQDFQEKFKEGMASNRGLIAASSDPIRNDRVNILALLSVWNRVAPPRDPLRPDMEALEAECKKMYKLDKGEL